NMSDFHYENDDYKEGDLQSSGHNRTNKKKEVESYYRQNKTAQYPKNQNSQGLPTHGGNMSDSHDENDDYKEGDLPSSGHNHINKNKKIDFKYRELKDDITKNKRK